MQFVTIPELQRKRGLRIVLVAGTPSPWGQAAKAIIEYKGLDYSAALMEPGGANEDLVAFAGVNSAPVVAWEDEKPLDRWIDILYLLERLGPQKRLIPEDPAARVQLIGLSHEICGELGLAWNRRLQMFQPAIESDEPPEGITRMARKYGYNDADVAAARDCQVASLNLLAAHLKAQRERGSHDFVGESVTALDFYWAAFSTLFALPSPDQVPMNEAFRPLFERVDPAVKAALDPILLEHRDRMIQGYFKIPMEL